jgi:hypothetical protein
LSDLKSIAIEQATVRQLRDFATLHLGLEVSPASNRARILALIEQAGYAKETITLAPDDEPVVSGAATFLSPAQARAKMPGSDVDTAARDERMIEIIVPFQSEPGGKEPIRLGVNGRAMLVPRAKRVKIRYPYFEVLARAQKEVFEQDAQHQMTSTFVPIYPYQLIGGLDEDEHEKLRESPRKRGADRNVEAA